MGIESLETITTGRYVITTRSGTTHYLDLDAKVAIRQGAPGREWGREVLFADPLSALPGVMPKVAVTLFETAAPDGTPFFYDHLSGVAVGSRMRLDNADEWRVTSTIESIELWEES